LKFVPPALGWQRDTPDFRDYTIRHPRVQQTLARLKRPVSGRSRIPLRVDLREYFSDVEDQGTLNSSTACACTALVQYFEQRAHGRLCEPSKLFLHQMTRKLGGGFGNTVADLRTTLQALIHFGVPPEQYWPYDPTRFDDQPTDPVLFTFGRQYHAIHHFRLDCANCTGVETLAAVKSCLSAGFPSVFGFPVPSSLSLDGDIPYRPTFDSIRGGQAVVAVGYDDRRIRSTKGALLIRNSWGKAWGEAGYGWVPYAFVESQLAVDFWTLLKQDWLDSGEFDRPPDLQR